MQPEIEAFWNAYLAGLSEGEAPPGTYQAWSFGNNKETADELAGLVLSGLKTATASLFWSYEAQKEELPKAGDLSVILDGEGKPVCIIETIAVDTIPFREVSAQHAWEEGEGDRSLTFWRTVHWQVFSAECAVIDRQPDERMPVCCERFRILFP